MYIALVAVVSHDSAILAIKLTSISASTQATETPQKSSVEKHIYLLSIRKIVTCVILASSNLPLLHKGILAGDGLKLVEWTAYLVDIQVQQQ